ncbi:MAG: hypothetical protein NTU62_03360 [Spirochaetes bacterium]|nr:hypothetical protein [Spirochaetota bacterium]
MRTFSRPAAAACILLLAACHARFELFAFEVNSPGEAERSVELRESPGSPPEREGLLGPSQEQRDTPVYRLSKPVSVDGEGLAFVIGYVSDIDSLTLTLFQGRDEPLVTVSLPATGDLSYRYQAALVPGSRVWGFQLGAGPGSGSLALQGAGLEPLVHGFRFDPEGLTLDGSISVTGSSPGLLTARLSDGLRDRMQAERWQLELEIPGGDATVRLSAPETSTASFAVPTDGPRRVMLHEGSVGFLPRQMRVSVDQVGAGPAALSCRVSSVPDASPIPADPGLILGWRRPAWRDPEAEVFVWPRLHEVLIFDTATYEVQERFFRRLAFFVEKPGTAGTIPSLGEVEGRRSWNAHDYRAEDLARFFSLAADGPLTAEESRLRELLIASGIIRANGASYAPGTGAVLSISRESSASLRELLITHEAFHGVFFALPAFREACRAAWDALDPDERQVWLAFLDLKGYNTADPYLVVNEFQSYLFQQERGEVSDFQAITLQRVRDAYPGLTDVVRRVEAGHPDSFLDAFDALDQALAAAGGPHGGRVLGVRRTAP